MNDPHLNRLCHQLADVESLPPWRRDEQRKMLAALRDLRAEAARLRETVDHLRSQWTAALIWRIQADSETPYETATARAEARISRAMAEWDAREDSTETRT